MENLLAEFKAAQIQVRETRRILEAQEQTMNDLGNDWARSQSHVQVGDLVRVKHFTDEPILTKIIKVKYKTPYFGDEIAIEYIGKYQVQEKDKSVREMRNRVPIYFTPEEITQLISLTPERG